MQLLRQKTSHSTPPRRRISKIADSCSHHSPLNVLPRSSTLQSRGIGKKCSTLESRVTCFSNSLSNLITASSAIPRKQVFHPHSVRTLSRWPTLAPSSSGLPEAAAASSTYESGDAFASTSSPASVNTSSFVNDQKRAAPGIPLLPRQFSRRKIHAS